MKIKEIEARWRFGMHFCQALWYFQNNGKTCALKFALRTWCQASRRLPKTQNGSDKA
jgi:hypothetical protein